MKHTFEPMLATDADLECLVYPMLASAKFDGVRAVVLPEGVYSRKLKLIPNAHVQAMFFARRYIHLDGELIVGNARAEDCCRATTSGVMTRDGEPDVTFNVFDTFVPGMVAWPYHRRFAHLQQAFFGKAALHRLIHVQLMPQVQVNNLKELLAFEAKTLALGYEGICLRNPKSQYKFGRSTVKEGELLRVKRTTDDEAVVIGFKEGEHNNNVATTNELGRTKRSSHKAGKEKAGTLGSLICRYNGQEINVSAGKLTAEERQHIWAHQTLYRGKLVKFRHFEIGVKDAPRMARFIAWRNEIDT